MKLFFPPSPNKPINLGVPLPVIPLYKSNGYRIVTSKIKNLVFTCNSLPRSFVVHGKTCTKTVSFHYNSCIIETYC